MNSDDAERQILQMIEFIKQEAREKAEEISVKTENEFNANKLTSVLKGRHELQEEFDNKRKELGSRKRIARSRRINETRVEKMRTRDGLLQQLKKEVRARLVTLSEHERYPDLIRALLVQGMMTLQESRITVRSREMDEAVVRAQLEPALAEYKAIIAKACGGEPKLTLEYDSKYLAPPPKEDEVGVSCLGGVVLSARHGKILCRNTLDQRFELIFKDLLPVIREMVFERSE